MAQRQPGRIEPSDQPQPPVEARTTQPKPGTVEIYERPHERPQRAANTTVVAVAVLLFFVLVILAMLFLRF